MTEEQTITLVKNGEPGAYRALVERYQTGLIIHCENIVRDRATAEDIAQDAFVKAYYSLSEYSTDKGAFATWLYAIANNRAKDYLRKHRRQAELPEDFDPPSEEPLPQGTIRDIRTAITRLQPPEYATVVKAYYWEGKSYQEIADELSVPSGTIGTWLTRAKTQLRKELV